MIKHVNEYWTRDAVKKDTAHVYLFADNIQDARPNSNGKYFIPSETQAVIRGLPNAIGIPTKKDRGNSRDSFFWDNDNDFKLFKMHVDTAIEKAKASGKPIKISAHGFGTGKAALKGVFATDPGGRFFTYLYSKLGELA